MSGFDDFVRAVEQATGKPGRKVGHNIRLLCPAHDDHNPSLDVAENNDGKPLTQCRSHGCTFQQICHSIGREPHEFLGSNGNGHIDAEWTPHGPAAAVYDYVDENGTMLYQVLRTADKQFPARRPDPTSSTGWRWNIKDTRRVLYRLPHIIQRVAAGDPIYICEGEKDVHAIERIAGIGAATCNPGGAGNWRAEYADSLHGANRVVIVADNDTAGHTHALHVRDQLSGRVGTVEIVTAATGKDAHDHIAAGHSIDEFVPLNTTETGPCDQPPFALTLQEFLAADLPSVPALLGTEEDTIIPAGGLVVIAGMPAVGKTTLALDLVLSLATPRDWLGLQITRPLNILLLENEGPQRLFQTKLQRKVDAWKQPLSGSIHIQTLHWGAFTFRNTTAYDELGAYLDKHQIDIVVGDPLDTLGPTGVGSPEDTREFVSLLVPLGLTANRTFLFLHHFRKEISTSEINMVSGAWGGRLDTLLVLRDTDRPDEVRLSFPKLRHGDQNRRPMILGKVANTATFELIAEEAHEAADDTKAEEMLRQIIGVLQRCGTTLERPALALRCDVAPADRSFQRALSLGKQRGLLASEQKGRKAIYALTEDSWDI